MAGIPVHTSSPINTNATKAGGITPVTTQPTGAVDRSTPAYAPATTTASSSYPVARPAAAPGPAPTGAAQPTSYVPTSTVPHPSSQTSNSPAPPQPGAVPSPFTGPPSTGTRSSVPPPPKVGEIPKPAAYYTPQRENQSTPQSQYSSPHQQPQPPPQFSSVLSTPSRAIPPASTTSVPAYQPGDLSHPPGYIQNNRGSFEDQRNLTNSPFGQNYNNSSSHRSGLLDSGRNNDDAEEGPIAAVWKTATSWAKTAGEKLKEGEEEVWRRINNEK